MLEKQVRAHRDINLAIEWQDVPRLREILAAKGYRQAAQASQYNFVLRDEARHQVDVHAFIYDDNRNVIDGVMYPAESLTGIGAIDGKSVNCISPEWMIKFLAAWIHKRPEKYAPAIAALCDKFAIDLPQEYVEFKNSKSGM